MLNGIEAKSKRDRSIYGSVSLSFWGWLRDCQAQVTQNRTRC